jgi:membrane fusion protein (multidrug efflux system)
MFRSILIKYRERPVRYSIIGILSILLIGFVIMRLVDATKPPQAKKQPIPLVRIAQASHEDVLYKLEYNGDVLPVLQANVFSRVSGMLEAVYTDMGRTVQRGQLIALIDTAQAHQSELQAEAVYYNAKATEARTRDLVKKNLASQQDLDNAVAALRTAEANYEAARINLSYTHVRAPFHGYVTKRYLDPGAVVSTNPVATGSNTTIVTIMNIDTVKIDVNVLDIDIPKLSQVTRAVVTLDALPGRQFDAKVSRAAQAINTTTRTMPVEILIPNRDEAIKPGAFAHVTLILGEHPNALTVPTQAILHDKEGDYVLLAQDSIAKRCSVITGVTQSGSTEILSGLDGSEPIIVMGQNFAKPNGKIIIVRTPTTSTAARTDSSVQKSQY